MEIKNAVTISLIVFILIIVSILGAAVFINQSKTAAPIVSTANNNVATNNSTAASFTATQVASHSTAADCWVIISNKVYDVTKLIPVHTGGPNAIIPHCGKDGTTAFETKDGMGQHSNRAQNILNTYFIGNLSN